MAGSMVKVPWIVSERTGAKPRRKIPWYAELIRKFQDFKDNYFTPSNGDGDHRVCGHPWVDHDEGGECPIKRGGRAMEGISDYVAIGGAPVVKEIVEDLYIPVLDDEVTGSYFSDSDMPRLKSHMAALLSEVMGGPKQYTGLSMVDAHKGRGVTEDALSRVAVHLVAAFQKNNVSEEIISRTAEKVMSYRHMIVQGQEDK
jgi:hemoglobin